MFICSSMSMMFNASFHFSLKSSVTNADSCMSCMIWVSMDRESSIPTFFSLLLLLPENSFGTSQFIRPLSRWRIREIRWFISSDDSGEKNHSCHSSVRSHLSTSVERVGYSNEILRVRTESQTSDEQRSDGAESKFSGVVEKQFKSLSE